MRAAALVAALLVLCACGDGGCEYLPAPEKPTHVAQ